VEFGSFAALRIGKFKRPLESGLELVIYREKINFILTSDQ
jgi:hypothetical protein